MTATDSGQRENQRRRTRKDLLQATAKLLQKGRTPTFDEVAEAAMVSRATAYRYFAGIDALLVEASLDVAIPDVAELLQDAAVEDPVARVECIDSALDAVIRANEASMRTMLMHSLQQRLRDGEVPARQNRRTPLIVAALKPARRHFKPAALDLLTKSLALVVGTESMIVFKDVLQLDDAGIRKVKRWMIRALIDAARNPASSS